MSHFQPSLSARVLLGGLIAFSSLSGCRHTRNQSGDYSSGPEYEYAPDSYTSPGVHDGYSPAPAGAAGPNLEPALPPAPPQIPGNYQDPSDPFPPPDDEDQTVYREPAPLPAAAERQPQRLRAFAN